MKWKLKWVKIIIIIISIFNCYKKEEIPLIQLITFIFSIYIYKIELLILKQLLAHSDNKNKNYFYYIIIIIIKEWKPKSFDDDM